MEVVGTALKGLAVAFIFSVVITAGTGYLATLNPFLSFIFGVIMMLVAVTTILWVIARDGYLKRRK